MFGNSFGKSKSLFCLAQSTASGATDYRQVRDMISSLTDAQSDLLRMWDDVVLYLSTAPQCPFPNYVEECRKHDLLLGDSCDVE
jgi:hypothetical protein